MELLLIGLLGLAMGIVTSISGGAGVFAVPTMLAMGIPPLNVLALNRMSDVGVVAGAVKKYHQSKNINWKLAMIAAIPMGIGAFAGANFVIQIPKEWMNYIILGGVIVGIFFLLKPVNPQEKANKVKFSVWGGAFLLLVGFWNGAFGMAGATFAVLVLVHLFNLSFLEARGTEVAAAIPETMIAVTVLYFGSTVSTELMITMFATSFIGAWIGSRLAVKHGSEFIKKAMVFIAVVMIIKVVVSSFI